MRVGNKIMSSHVHELLCSNRALTVKERPAYPSITGSRGKERNVPLLSNSSLCVRATPSSEANRSNSCLITSKDSFRRFGLIGWLGPGAEGPEGWRLRCCNMVRVIRKRDGNKQAGWEIGRAGPHVSGETPGDWVAEYVHAPKNAPYRQVHLVHGDPNDGESVAVPAGDSLLPGLGKKETYIVNRGRHTTSTFFLQFQQRLRLDCVLDGVAGDEYWWR